MTECLDVLKENGTLIIVVPALNARYSNLDRNIGHYRRHIKQMIWEPFAGPDARIERSFLSNFPGVIASFIFPKLGKLDRQFDRDTKKRFMWLSGVYSRFFIPLVQAYERVVAVPVGLNLTVVVRKGS